MTRLERLEYELPRAVVGWVVRDLPHGDDVAWAISMLREADKHLEKHICHGHPCAVCVWKAKLREEA